MKAKKSIVMAVAASLTGLVAIALSGCEWFSFNTNKPKEVSDQLGYGSDTAAWLHSATENGDSAELTPALRSSVAIAALPETLKSVSFGSGVIYKFGERDLEGNTEAFVITNYHVTNGCDVFLTYLYGDKFDNSTYESLCSTGKKATYVGGSEKEDIAVLSIKIPADRADYVLPISSDTSVDTVGVRDSDGAKPGENVYAIGNFLGDGISVVSGIVAVEAEENDNGMHSMRIDAPVTHGNSGGGLFDKNGELLGIVYGGMDKDVKTKNDKDEEVWDTVSITGYGWAIPANRALSVAQSILDNPAEVGKKTATRGLLGTLEVNSSKGVVFGDSITIVEDVVIGSIENSNHPFYGTDVEGKVIRKIIVTDSNEKEIVNKEITRKHQIESILFNIRLGNTVKLFFEGDGEVPVTATYGETKNFERA